MTYIIQSKLYDFVEPKEFKLLAKKVSEKIKEECTGLEWKQSFVTMDGSCDIIDIVESEDPRQIDKAVMIIRSLSDAETETMTATSWQDFLDIL